MNFVGVFFFGRSYLSFWVLFLVFSILGDELGGLVVGIEGLVRVKG